MTDSAPPEEHNLTVGLLQQFKQLSVPLWARSLALGLGIATFVGGLWLLWLGTVSCTGGDCNGLLDTGVRVVTATFVPVLVLIYLVFAHTGVSALTRKSRELLTKTIPEALRTRSAARDLLYLTDAISHSQVEVTHHHDVPTAHYRLTLNRGGSAARIRFQIDFNVNKINVVIFIPYPRQASAESAGPWLARHFPGTFEGARHEGYLVDQAIGCISMHGADFLKVCLRRRLPDDFLWNSAGKLYFAQDLRYFLFSLAEEGWHRFSAGRT